MPVPDNDAMSRKHFYLHLIKMSGKHFYYPIIDKRLADVRVPEDDLAVS